ncbi:hypothetical protein [Bacillus toyonensis]|uniref:hypothetical protein n=1 Tax=Bacillus toyonensis TaxID=155322 RepID=UPI0036E598DD
MEPLIDVILYFVFYFGALFLILGTALVLFIASALPVIRKKNLSFIMISLGLNYSSLFKFLPESNLVNWLKKEGAYLAPSFFSYKHNAC